ncbi:MAG: serine/threonine-protein kinase [Pyrinomonadaceae bacterium]
MEVPRVIAGRFQIEEEIGTGGMGTVYRATHLGLDRPVAVKIIKPQFAADADVADRFLREARTMAKLRHSNAAMIFDAGKLPDGRQFIVMEYVEGHTLSEALAREGRFSAQRAVDIAKQICDVLAEAHSVGIIHRDLKPSNIMPNERGVRVLDFGVAKVLASSAESTATHASTGSGQLIGTPRYMSPEQCLGQRVGVRSDLYSLGVLLYEMLAGRPPFVDPLQSALLVKQATALPPPLPRLREDIPRRLTMAVHTLLAKRPDDRPATAAAAKTLLQRSLTHEERIVTPTEPMSAMVAAANHGRSLLFRVGTPLVLVVTFGALLTWGYTGESAFEPRATSGAMVSLPASQQQMVPASFRSEQPMTSASNTSLLPRKEVTNGLTPERAHTIAAGFAHGAISATEVLDTDSGPAIVAIHEQRRTGQTHFFVLQKKAGRFRVVSHGPLDRSGFTRATWTAEKIDADEDGYGEILFSGRDAKENPRERQLVLFVPNDNRTYSAMVTGESTASGAPRIIWRSNASGTDAAAYRTALRQKARTLVGRE